MSLPLASLLSPSQFKIVLQRTNMHRIFILLAIINVFSLVLGARQRDRVNLIQTTKTCSKDVNLPREDANKLIRGVLERNDETAQCFVKCFYVQLKIMDDAGTFDMERLKKVIPRLSLPKKKVSTKSKLKNLIKVIFSD